jgi:hypothetical protein
VRRDERRGELLAAYDNARRGLEEHPDDIELAYRAVLAMARTGAADEAKRQFIDLGLAAVEAEDVSALHARIQKDLALAAVGNERRRLAAVAASSYESIARRYGTYFPTINAATLSLVAGDRETARVLAKRALTLVDASNDDTFYALATQAEARLLLGDLTAAGSDLERAAGLHGGDFGAVSTARRQLRLICTITGTEPGILSALAGPSVAHFCGHMIASSDGSQHLRHFDEKTAALQIAEVLNHRPVSFAYGSLAAGADVLWAEALLGSGAELHVVLPFVVDDFVESSVVPSGPGWVPRFHQCLEAAESITYATEDRFLGSDVLFGYCSELAMGLALLRARFLDSDAFQLALWDGAPAAGAVGTAADVASWSRTSHEVVKIAPVDRDGDGRSRRPPASTVPETPRVIRALLMGDMRGFSKLSDQQLHAFSHDIMSPFADVLSRHGADVEYRNTWGDALFAVISNVPAAARCALEIQEAMATIDLEALGLPPQLAFRLSGHVGPVIPHDDPILGAPSFMGAHVSRTARIEPVTPPGAVYVTEAFAAALELANPPDLRCDYVGHLPAAKDYGRIRMYNLCRRAAASR